MSVRKNKVFKVVPAEKYKELTGALYKYRQAHNMSQEDLARLIGTSVFSICRWERGKHYPAQGNIKLMKLLGVL